LTFKEAEVQLPRAIRQFALDHPPDRIDTEGLGACARVRATGREPCRPRSATANDAQVFGWGRSEVLSAGDRRVRYSAPDSARKAIAGDCLCVGDPRSWPATCRRNRHDRHRAASTNLINALSLIRTCRPTRTNSIRRSAIKRRTNRGPVFNSSPAWSTVSRRSMCCHSLTVDCKWRARRSAVDSDRTGAGGPAQLQLSPSARTRGACSVGLR
jgi:hypothetical protein